MSFDKRENDLARGSYDVQDGAQVLTGCTPVSKTGGTRFESWVPRLLPAQVRREITSLAPAACGRLRSGQNQWAAA